MSQAIIRGLWGDERTSHDQYNDPLAAYTKQICDTVEERAVIDRVYCFGDKNAELLKSFGIDPVLLSHEPYAAPRLCKRLLGSHNFMMWGMSYWWHKRRILQIAAEEFDHVLWLDFDVRQVKPLPDNFWRIVKKGPPFKSPLQVRKSFRRSARWRTFEDRRMFGIEVIPSENPKMVVRITPGGGCYYIRRKDVADELMAIQEEFPCFSELPILALMVDRMYGKWIGVKEYVRKGHDNIPGYDYVRRIYRPLPEDVVWTCGRKSKKQRNYYLRYKDL